MPEVDFGSPVYVSDHITRNRAGVSDRRVESREQFPGYI